MGDFWVFGYGSLMWRPGFPHDDVEPARLHGLHRALCVYSYVHRGTKPKPGLVMGLARGGSCRGLAFRVRSEHRADVIAYLREREQVTSVYLERWRPFSFAGNRQGSDIALCYLADPEHEQYAGRLGLEDQLRHIRGNAGISGDNEDYLLRTVGRLRELGIRDENLEAIAEKL